MRPRAGNAEHPEPAVRRAQRHAAEGAILKPQFLQRLSPYCKPVIPFPVRDAQRLLLLMYPPTRRFFHRNIRRGELPCPNGVPKHVASAFLEDDEIQEIKVELRTKKRGEIVRQIFGGAGGQGSDETRQRFMAF